MGFLGVNGAGKTTTFLLASGLLTPAEGVVQIMGVDPSQDKSWTHKVGVLTAGAGLYPRLSVRRNLAFFAKLYGKTVDLDLHMKEHGLTEFADQKAGQLSQGFRRRLSLARATVHAPELLLLDEPAEGLDPAGTQHLHEYLRGFVKRGGAVLFTSHRLEEVERLCHRILLLDEGRISVEGTPESLNEAGGEGGLRKLILQLQEKSATSASSREPS